VRESIRRTLEELVGPEALIPEGVADRWQPGPAVEGERAVVVAPPTEEVLARLLEKASREGWRVLPAGLGSWLQGGGPVEVNLVVSTKRMTRVHCYEPADLTVTAGAGLSMKTLRETTLPQGQWLPLDPPGGSYGSLGAAAALGFGGPLQQLYGTPRDHVLGLTMVSGDGRVLRWGGKVVKNVAGFDLTRLSVGSWGSLGVITSVSARLFPIPEAEITLVLSGPGVAELLPAARAAALSSLPLAAVELVDPLDSEGPAAVLRLMGSVAQVAEMEARLHADLSDLMPGGRRLEGEESRALHEGLGRWEENAALVARLCLLPSRMEALLEEAEALRALATGWAEPGTEVRLSAHVGAGVLRVSVSKLPEREEALEPWVSTLRGLRGRLEEKGGSLTLTSGPAFLMKGVGAWGGADGVEGLMVGLKARFDPEGILAPGRLGLS
jgi:glycolate oxidase FAD binding subunit